MCSLGAGTGDLRMLTAVTNTPAQRAESAICLNSSTLSTSRALTLRNRNYHLELPRQQSAIPAVARRVKAHQDLSAVQDHRPLQRPRTGFLWAGGPETDIRRASPPKGARANEPR